MQAHINNLMMHVPLKNASSFRIFLSFSALPKILHPIISMIANEDAVFSQYFGFLSSQFRSSDQRSILYNSSFIRPAINTVQFSIHQISGQYCTILHSSDQLRRRKCVNKSALQAYLFVFSFTKIHLTHAAAASRRQTASPPRTREASRPSSHRPECAM